MKKFFNVVEHDKTFWILLTDRDKLPFKIARGSFAVFGARVMGISYADYLRVARDTYGATLKGITGWIVFFFTDKKDAQRMCDDLNLRLHSILMELDIL